MDVQITFPNWKKFNPRPDIENPSWFRCQNDLFISTLWFELTDAEFRFFIFSLCMASKKKGVITSTYNNLSRLSGVKLEAIKKAITKLESLEVINTSRPRNGDVTGAVRTRTSAGVTYGTNGTDGTNGTNGTDADVGTQASADAFPTCLSLQAREFLSEKKVPSLVVERWLGEMGYPPDYIIKEIAKMLIWLGDNAARAPKHRWGTWITQWLVRGWDRHRKSINSIPASEGGKNLTMIAPNGTEMACTESFYTRWKADFESGRDKNKPYPLKGE